MTNLSKELCKICGIEPKWIEYKTENTDGCINFGSKKVYPDFEQPENFVKLFRVITTLEEFSFTTNCFYVPSIPSYRQNTTLATDDEKYHLSDLDPIRAFVACVIKHCKQDKDTAEYIGRVPWKYE